MLYGTISNSSGIVQSSEEMQKNANEVLECFFEKTDGMDVTVIKSILSIALAKMFLVLESQLGDKFCDFSDNLLKLVEDNILEMKKECEGVH